MPQQIVVAVVENHNGSLRALQRMLLSLGFGVEAYHSAEAFLGALEFSEAACALVDVHLGAGMSGLDLARELSTSNRRIPLLLMSASVDATLGQKAAALGCVDFLEKPFLEERLLGALRAALGQTG